MNSAGAVPARRVGIDVGGTKAQGIVLDPEDRVVAQARRETPRGRRSLDSLVARVAELAEELEPDGPVGVGVPGLVGRDGVLHAAPNLDGVAHFEVQQRLRERLEREVSVDSDGTNSALGEWQLGAGRGATDMVLVTLGTGIGGGLVMGDRLQRGRNGFAGEIGHMVVDRDGPRCPCGRQGCWERYASGSGLARLAQEATAARRLTSLVDDVGGDPADVRGEHVMAAARAGDRDALDVVEEFAGWVALGLSNLANALDPQMFVLGGGLAEGADLYLDPIRRHFPDFLYQPDLRPLPEIRFAEWGPLAGAVGAALLPEHDAAG